MQKPLLVTLAVLLLAGSSAFAVDPAVEALVEAMDRKAEQGKLAEVLDEAKARVARADNAVNRYLLGRAYGMNREYEKAREQFERVQEMDLSSPLSYHGLGAYYLVKGELDEAERNLRKAIELDGTFTRAHVELGKLYLAKQDSLAARRQFLKVLDFEPDNNDVRALLAFQYLNEQRWQQAAEEFLVVLSKNPDHAGALKGLGITQAMEKKSEEAIRSFEKVLTLEPKDFQVYEYLTKLYLGDGNKEKAIETLERLLLVVPTDSRIAVAVRAEIKNIRDGRLPPNAKVTLPILLEQLKSGSVEVRRDAMARLAANRSQFPAPPREVVHAVKDEDPLVRTMAIRWIGEIKDPVILPLLEILARHPKDREENEKVRATVAQALGKTGNAACIPILLALVTEDESFRVYRASVAGLRDLSGVVRAGDASAPLVPEGREALTKSWNDWWRGRRSLSRKLDAIATIGTLKSGRMCRYLLPLLADPEVLVAGRAREALERSTGETIGTAEDLKTVEGRERVVKAALAAVNRLERRPKKAVKPTK